MHNQTLLITGASGFLGTWLADAAYTAGYRIIGIDLRAPSKPQIWAGFATSSCDTTDLVSLLQGESLYAVCHLAGGASVAGSFADPYGDFASLVPGISRLAVYLAKAQPQARLYFFSSAAVYGNPLTLPITERTRVLPISPYGVHKATTESLMFHYARVLKLKFTTFRIFSVFGPGLKKQIVWDVGQHALTAISEGKTSITLFGTGEESRDFIYVKDLCKAVLTVLAHTSSHAIEIYNLASGIESRISEVAKCLIQKLELPLGISFNGEVRKGDPLNWRADISKLQALGFKADYNLEAGLAEIAAWMSKPAPAATIPA